MKRIGILSVALTFFGSVSAQDYEAMLQNRNERLDAKVAEEVGKQMREMRGKLQYLQNRIERFRVRKDHYGSGAVAPTTEDGDKAPWLFTSFNAWKEYLRERPAIDYLPELHTESFDFSVSYDWGHQAYDEKGNKKDVAHITFGQASFPLHDAFAASGLLAEKTVDVVETTSSDTSITTEDHYLYILKDQLLAFNSSYNRQEFRFAYNRRFYDDKLSVKIIFPLVREAHKIVLEKEINETQRAALQGKVPAFYNTYDGMEDFVVKTLARSGTDFKKNDERWGVGDLTFLARYVCDLRYTDKASIGMKVTLGTGKVSEGVTMYPINLGNEGASSLTVDGKVSWHRGQYANPYISAKIGYNLPVRVVRRAPYSMTYNGKKSGMRMMDVLPASVPFGNVIKLGATPFDAMPETIAREFGSHAQMVTMYKGFEGGLRIANRCEKCFDQPFAFELGYDLFLGESKSHNNFDENGLYNESVLNKNTYRLKSTIDASFGYYFNEKCSLTGSFAYDFAGRNVTANYHAGLSLNASF